MPRDSRIAAREAAAIPLPREETTPPVTKMNLVMPALRPYAGADHSTGGPAAVKNLPGSRLSARVVSELRMAGKPRFARQKQPGLDHRVRD